MSILLVTVGALLVAGPVALGFILKRLSDSRGNSNLLHRHALKLLILTAVSSTVGSRLIFHGFGWD